MSWEDVADAIRILGDPLVGAADRDGAARTLAGGFRSWAHTYLTRRFWSAWNAGCDSAAVIDDAVQHLLFAVLRGKANLTSASGTDEIRSWCMRVLQNFVISELRTKKVKYDAPLDSFYPEFDRELEAHDLAEKLLSALRTELSTIARPRDWASLDNLMSGFVRGVLANKTRWEGEAGPPTNLARQHRFRGRRIASKCFEALRRRAEIPSEFLAISRALTIDGSAEGEPPSQL